MSLESVLEQTIVALKELTEAVNAMSSAAPVGKKPTPTPAKAEPKATKAVVKAEPKSEPVKEESKEIEEEVVVEETEAALTIDAVRKQLMPLVAEYNPLIAETIKSLGAANLSSLDASKYQELLDTINEKIAASQS